MLQQRIEGVVGREIKLKIKGGARHNATVRIPVGAFFVAHSVEGMPSDTNFAITQEVLDGEQTIVDRRDIFSNLMKFCFTVEDEEESFILSQPVWAQILLYELK